LPAVLQRFSSALPEAGGHPLSPLEEPAMSSPATHRRGAVGVALALVAAGSALYSTAGQAYAYNFPFNGRCGQDRIYDYDSQTEADYDHSDGGLLYYKIWWGRTQPDPSHPYDQSNWASCRVGQ
jgi:hypothetical protein